MLSNFTWTTGSEQQGQTEISDPGQISDCLIGVQERIFLYFSGACGVGPGPERLMLYGPGEKFYCALKKLLYSPYRSNKMTTVGLCC